MTLAQLCECTKNHKKERPGRESRRPDEASEEEEGPSPHRTGVPCPYLQGHSLPLEAAVVAALVRVRVALHPVTSGCSGHSCDGHDPPVLVILAATCPVRFSGLAVGGAHRLGGGGQRQQVTTELVARTAPTGQVSSVRIRSACSPNGGTEAQGAPRAEAEGEMDP